MLGFSDLTEAHPDRVVFDWDAPHGVSAEMSASVQQLHLFHDVLETLNHHVEGLAPLNVMTFSDCAFAVYTDAQHTALVSSVLMRQCLKYRIPVRMGLASGTCHIERVSNDVVQGVTVTRAEFSGTGVVRATQAEKHGGKGCRIFLHSSIDATALAQIREHMNVLETPEQNCVAPRELNYLHADPLDETAEDPDERLFQGATIMHGMLTRPIPASLQEQYVATFDAFR